MQPNILVIMVDQLNGTLFPDGPASFLQAPNLSRLAERSVRFNANYSASPLCAPSRAAMAGESSSEPLSTTTTSPRSPDVASHERAFATQIPIVVASSRQGITTEMSRRSSGVFTRGERITRQVPGCPPW